MRKLIILLLFISSALYGQLDTIDLKISDFGLPSRPGEADFMRNEAYKINFGLANIDGFNNFIDVTDSSIIVEEITYSDTYWDDLRVPLTNTKINPANSDLTLKIEEMDCLHGALIVMLIQPMFF